jgi:pyridoxamine 5'-phosphate oxidase
MPNQDHNPAVLAGLNLQDQRRNYTVGALNEDEMPTDPFIQLRTWLANATEAGMLEPNAMVISTVSETGLPAARVVLLKEIDLGLVFYTNYNSRKGIHLATNSVAAATFFWDKLERQVRIEGIVEKVSRKQSEKYFQSRPVGSQIGAIVSPQSEKIVSRNVLELKTEKLVNESKGAALTCPEHWGGYRLIPYYIEFWQGRPSRLHDRIVYERQEAIAEPNVQPGWTISRLAP